jgi:hypothetical protein
LPRVENDDRALPRWHLLPRVTDKAKKMPILTSTPDGSTVFIAGPDAVVVQPVP